MVLELLIDAKSAIKKFRPIRSLLCKSHYQNGGLWLVEIFLLQIWHIWAILRPFYPWSFFDSGIISKKKSLKTHFWGPFHKFFSRILNNSLKKWDFIKNMSMPKVGNQKLREQKRFSKNGQKVILLATFGQFPFNHLRVLVQRFPKWYDKWRWALQGQFKIFLDFNQFFLDFLYPL